MAWSPQLGMRVFDPREGAQIGLQAGQAFARSYGAAQDRQLDERKLQMMEAEVAEKARLNLRRQIGLQAMTEETQELIAAKVDPDTARKNAFLKYAPMIYGNSDQGLAVLQRIEASEEANNIRRMGQIELDARIRDLQEARNEIAGKNQEINLLRITQGASDKAEQRRLEEERELGREKRATEREVGIEKRAEEREGRLEKQFNRQLMLRANADPALKKIDDQLAESRKKLASVIQNPRILHPFTTEESVKKGIAELEKARVARLQELGLDPEIVPSASTGGEQSQQGANVRLGTIVEQGGKRYRYQGGDTKDPASWVEVK